MKIFRQDFYREFGPRCAGCQLVFSETEKVRKIDQSFFHGHCFKCSVCSKDLTEAEKVGCDQNGNLLCEADFLKHHCDDLDNGGHTSLLDECEGDKKDEQNLPNRDLNEGNSEEEQDLNKEVIDDPKNKRKRGPKTTIKPHQLEILKNCFDQNPKPTPKVFEELSKDTGLSKRVIQVWFQNKRSKSKRINKMQSLISMGQSFPAPIPGLGFPPPHHPAWDPCHDPLRPAPDYGSPYGPMGPGGPFASDHDSRGYDRSGYGGHGGGPGGPGGGGYPGDPGDPGSGGPGGPMAISGGYTVNTVHHFQPGPGNCYPSPPSQASDFVGPAVSLPNQTFTPVSSCSLSSFPSPAMESAVYSQD